MTALPDMSVYKLAAHCHDERNRIDVSAEPASGSEKGLFVGSRCFFFFPRKLGGNGVPVEGTAFNVNGWGLSDEE